MRSLSLVWLAAFSSAYCRMGIPPKMISVTSRSVRPSWRVLIGLPLGDMGPVEPIPFRRACGGNL